MRLGLLVPFVVAATLAAQRGTIGGRAVDTAGAAVTGAVVRGPDGATVTTAADGRFEIEVADLATARLELRARGLATTTVVAAGRAGVGSIAMPQGASIVGRVRDTRGRPVAGVQVRAIDALTDLPFFENLRDPVVIHEASAVTDPDGAFRIDGGLVSAARVVAVVEAGIESAVEPVEAAEPVELVVPAVRSVSVRVVESQGPPVQRAMVVVEQDGRRIVAGWTDAEGELVARVPEGEGQTVVASVLRGGARSGSAPRALPPTGVVDGIVLAIDGDGLGALTLRADHPAFTAGLLFGGSPGPGGSADALALELANRPLRAVDGTLRIPFVPAATPFVAELRAPGRGRVSIRGQVAGSTELALELPVQAVARGTVHDLETGAPLAGVALRAYRAEGGAIAVEASSGGGRAVARSAAPPAETVSDSDGVFELRELGPGRWIVAASAGPMHRAREIPIEVRAGESLRGLRVYVDVGGAVQGRVAGAGPGLAVRAVTDAGVAARAPLGADGGFVLDRLPRGPVRIELEVPQPARLGAPRGLAVGEVRVGDAPVDASFDARELLRTVVGRVPIEGAAPPPGRLVVFLEPLAPRGGAADQQTLWLEGAGAFVEHDGSFELRTGLGEHVALVMDVATGVVLERLDGVVVEPGDRPFTIGPITTRVVRARIALAGPDAALRYARRIEVALGPLFPEGVGRMGFGSPITRAWDRGPGVALALGQRSVELYLPAAEVTLRLRGDRYGSPADNVLARQVVDPRDRPRIEVVLDVAEAAGADRRR